jgi:hypothetical protein
MIINAALSNTSAHLFQSNNFGELSIFNIPAPPQQPESAMRSTLAVPYHHTITLDPKNPVHLQQLSAFMPEERGITTIKVEHVEGSDFKVTKHIPRRD